MWPVRWVDAVLVQLRKALKTKEDAATKIREDLVVEQKKRETYQMHVEQRAQDAADAASELETGAFSLCCLYCNFSCFIEAALMFQQLLLMRVV